jgi:hypothetical protein
MDFIEELEKETEELERIWRILAGTFILLPEELKELDRQIKSNQRVLSYLK